MSYLLLVRIIIFAIANRARGSRMFEYMATSKWGRIVSVCVPTGIMAILQSQTPWALLLWAELMFWCAFSWNKYWSAAIGHGVDLTLHGCKPVDWVMAKLNLPVTTDFEQRIWGAVAMGVRQTFCIPFIVTAHVLVGDYLGIIFAVGTLLMGIPYLIGGYVANLFKSQNPVAIGEYGVGGSIALLAGN